MLCNAACQICCKSSVKKFVFDINYMYPNAALMQLASIMYD